MTSSWDVWSEERVDVNKMRWDLDSDESGLRECCAVRVPVGTPSDPI